MDAYELILAVFDEAGGAHAALEALKDREDDGSLRIFNAALAAKDKSGRATLVEDEDLGPGFGSLFGALVGGLIGLLGGPGGAIVGAAAGAATGGLVAGSTDLGFDDRFLKELKAALQPGAAALLVMVETRYGDAAAETLLGRGGRLTRHAVKQEVLDRLRGGLDE